VTQNGGTSGAKAPLRGPELSGADCFVLALNRMMTRNGQTGLGAQTHLVLAAAPDLDQLREAADKLGRLHPILTARVSRNPFTLLPYWRLPGSGKPLLITHWREAGVSNASGEAEEISSLQAWSEDILNRPLSGKDGWCNCRVDLVYLRDGRTVLVLTWSHLLFDGRGAEHLAAILLKGAEDRVAVVPQRTADVSIRLMDRIRGARPVVEHFFRLARNTYVSLGGGSAVPGRLRFAVKTLGETQTEAAVDRARALSGPLFNIAFYLACAARGHRRVFLSRSVDPAHYVVSVPVQIRRKGIAPSPFQNSVTILFFCLEREDLLTLDSAVGAAQKQFEEMTRSGLDRSFSHVLEIMKRLPERLYMHWVGSQFGGEITSFFHSYTGEFTLPLDTVFGSRALNAYHVPCVSAPPGSGLFLGVFKGRLSVTFSWRDSAVTPEEAGLMMDQVLLDLTGEAAIDVPEGQGA